MGNNMIERTLCEETIKQVGQEVLIQGWVQTRRDLGKIIFLDIRDRSGLIQAVCAPTELGDAYEEAKKARAEFVIEIKGAIHQRQAKNINPHLATGEIEVVAKDFKILAEAESLPFDLADEKIGLDVYLDHLPITLRTAKRQAIFKIQGEIVEAFRQFSRSQDFTEIQAPKIVGSSTEGGANVFEIKYFGHRAFLAQSPQFYKQIMVGIFERVFCIGNAFRAETHATTRHINEYTSLDFEMGFINDHTDVMNMETEFFRYLMEHLRKNCPREISLLKADLPAVPKEIPVFKLREIQQIIKKETGTDHTSEPDLEPNEEQWISDYVKKKHGSEFVFITHYPTAKRPMYTYPDEADPTYTKSFDLLFRGVEVTTGGQRVNNWEQLAGNIKKWGLDPADFSFYLEAFKYGMPPEGGLAIGLERLTAKLLGIENIKEATLFPRDLNRIDLPLSAPEHKQFQK